MRLIYVRHGQTDWNLRRKIQGTTDIPLNETGIAQAKEMHEKLKGEKIDVIISSTLKRAVKTAQIIKGDREIPILYDGRIVERRFGDLEGTDFDNLFFPGLNDMDAERFDNGIETLKQLTKRVFAALEDIAEKYHDKTVLFVSHGGVSVAVYCYFNGITTGIIDTKNIISKNCVPVVYEK